MTDADIRRRMITLRLTDEEYEALKGRYRTYGTRSISELARLALQRLITGPACPEDPSDLKLSGLDQRVRALESSVSLLLMREGNVDENPAGPLRRDCIQPDTGPDAADFLSPSSALKVSQHDPD